MFMLLRGSARAASVFTSLGRIQRDAFAVRCAQARPRAVGVGQSGSIWLRSSPGGRVSWVGVSWGRQAGEDRRVRMGWACAACTFVNEDAEPACGVCCEPALAPGEPTSDDASWACDACTFVNIGATAFCEICDTGRSAGAGLSALGVSAPGASFRPLRASARLEPEAVCVGANSGIEIVDSSGEECVVTGHTGLWSGGADLMSRKRKAKDAAMSDMAERESDALEVNDGKRKREDEDEPNYLLKSLHEERMARMKGKAADSADAKPENPPVSVSSSSAGIQEDKGVISVSSMSREQKLAYVEAEGTWLEKPSSEVVVLSYNVWFREDLELEARLDAIGDVILQRRPHVVFFQEVTENIFNIFQRASWWKSYACSVKPGVAAQRAYFCMQLSKLPVFSFRQSPFRNSVMGRELCLAELDAGTGARLLVATSHLESPCPAPPTWDQMFSPERVAQAKEAMSILKDVPNVVFGGDMNWDDKKDGSPPLPSGWIDAWLHLRPGQDGFTYDTKANRMLSGQRSLQKRLDRIFCRLRDFEAVSIEMVGTEAIPDLTYSKGKKVKGQVHMMELPVLPSDHFGLLLKLCRKNV